MTTTAMLDKEGLEKAAAAVRSEWKDISDRLAVPYEAAQTIAPTNHRLLSAAITAYLSHAAGDVAGMVTFLNEAAAYFQKRDSKGEDLAVWSNVYNAENCRKAATTILALSARAEAAEARVKEMEAALEPFAKLAAELFRIEDGREMNASKRDDAGVWGFDRVTITYGDFRAARSLSPIKEAGE